MLASLVKYRDFKLAASLETGSEYYRTYPMVRLGPLSTSSSRRYWGRAALVDAATFDTMQPVPLIPEKIYSNGKVLGTTAGISILHPAPDVTLRIQIEPKEDFTAFETGSEKVIKIRKISDTSYLVFATNPDRVFIYNGTLLTKVLDFDLVSGYSGVLDVAYFSGEIYFTYGGALRVYNLASGKLVRIELFNEEMHPTFLEKVGDVSYVIFIDDTNTRCYAITEDDFVLKWTLADQIATKTWTDGTSLFFACGTNLYQYVGTGSPVLLNETPFSDDITAIGPGAVGVNEQLWIFHNSSLVEKSAAGTDVLAIGTWDGDQDQLHYVFGREEDVLYEQTTDDIWTEGTTLIPPETTAVDEITAIETWKIVNDTNPDNIIVDERLLIGTGDSGIFFVFIVSRLNESAGAWEFTEIEDVTGVALQRMVPSE